MSVVELINIEKSYSLKNHEIPVLKNINVKFENGKFYAIMGHSGSGKSTLISIIDGIEPYTSGKVIINKKDLSDMNNKEKSFMRNNEIGIIFQDFFLDNYLTALENIVFPMTINDKYKKSANKRALELLKKVELENRSNHFPKELSGGEKQRVAIARALANDPNIIIADEPTGNLDEENESKIFSVLKRLSQEGKCVIVVSHSNEILKYADVFYELKEGSLIEK
ncbi:MAG: ABC transporter ATP-binding protein [Bacilli bacterium]|jgi:putative ABC transport system permease protein|nr:ABC transporter ATP-binding protein [Bacilli bacterium]